MTETLGSLWERVVESGADLEVYAGHLVVVEPDCGKCAPPYGCPPGSHMDVVRDVSDYATQKRGPGASGWRWNRETRFMLFAGIRFPALHRFHHRMVSWCMSCQLEAERARR